MTELPMIPLAIPSIGEEERANLNICVDEEMVSTVGRFVSQFEQQIAEISSTPDVVAVAAGTMGLHIALVSLGVGPGDLVILPSFTFIASSNAICHSGAQPWLMDIDPSSWTLDPAVVRKELEDNTERRGDDLVHLPSGKRVAAIMPVYTLGTPADMDALGSIAKEFRLPIVADAAAALGALYKGKPIAQFADLTVYSFNGNKTITTGGGGGVTGYDSAAMSRIRHLTTTARSTADYDHDLVGFNYRMTNLEAAVGCAQALKLHRFIEAKKAIRQAYDAAFRDTPECDPFPDPEWGSSVYWFSGIVMRPDSVMSAREVVRRLNTDFRIGARTFWKPVHLQQPYADAPRSPMTNSEQIWDRVVTLPCSTNLSVTDLNRVIQSVRAILSGNV